jgi:L-ribulose-5-phosphate 3-epimerase
MKIPIDRRQFIRRASLAASLAAFTPPALARDRSAVTIGLSQYSLRALFSSGKLDPLDYPAFAKSEFGLSEIDAWEGGLPAERLSDERYLDELRKRSADAGTHLFLLMGGVVDATGGAVAAEKKSRPADHQGSMERGVRLGCQYVRFFLRAPEGDRGLALERCVEALVPLCDHAGSRGITVVIEPGASAWTQDGGFLAEVMEKLRHPHCRLMPDFGKLRGDIYEGTRAMMPHTAVISAKTHEFDAAGNQIEFDYFRLMRIILEAGFRGTVALEWEGVGLDPVAGVHASKKLVERALAAL